MLPGGAEQPSASGLRARGDRGDHLHVRRCGSHAFRADGLQGGGGVFGTFFYSDLF